MIQSVGGASGALEVWALQEMRTVKAFSVTSALSTTKVAQLSLTAIS